MALALSKFVPHPTTAFYPERDARAPSWDAVESLTKKLLRMLESTHVQ
jgi:hypothetical protein